MRVQLIGTGDGEAEIGTGEAVSQLLSWFTGEANPALTENQTLLWPLTTAGGLGALAGSAAGAAALRAEVVGSWQAGRIDGEAGP